MTKIATILILLNDRPSWDSYVIPVDESSSSSSIGD